MKIHIYHLIALVLVLSTSGCRRPTAAGTTTDPVRSVAVTTQAPSAVGTILPTATIEPQFTPTPTPQPASRLHTADRLLFIGDWEQALAEYEIAMRDGEDEHTRAAALLGAARAYWSGRNLYAAHRTLETLLADYPFFDGRAEGYFLLAQIHSSENRHADAANAYTQFLDLRPGLIDAYIHNLRGDAYLEAGDYAAAAADFDAALEKPSRIERDLLRLKMARSYALAGDTPTALLIYDDLYNRTTSDDTRALIDVRKAEIFYETGQIAKAQEAYRDAVDKFPNSSHAYTALAALVEFGVEVDELQRGIIDYNAGQYGVAQAALDRYLQGSPADEGTALYYYGLVERELGETEDAIERWSNLIEKYPDHTFAADAWEQKGYTQWAFLEQYPAAVETLLGFAEANPQHPRAAEFLFDAGLISERDQKLEQAAEIWDRLARGYPADERSARALFLMGVVLYRLESYAGAADAFSRSLTASVLPADRAAAQMWFGKCQKALGDEAAARAAWESAAEIDPTGYYSERARDLIFNRPPFDPPLAFDLTYDLSRERRRAEDWMRQTFSLPADTDLSGPGALASNVSLLRGAELWRLGMPDEARIEFEAVRDEVAADAALSYRLANFLHDIGAYRSAIMTGRQVLNLAGMSDADTFSAPVFFNHLRFGTYYPELVLPLADQYNFHPLFIYSVIRQESLFEGFVFSSAGAHGLMQIIPATGAEISNRLGWPDDYAPEDLARPLVNLTFGVDYLDTQRTAFGGDPYAALAAYNAGQGNARVWYELAGGDPDLFLEIIRFTETRNYIRGVYELFSIYRMLYDLSLS